MSLIGIQHPLMGFINKITTKGENKGMSQVSFDPID